MGTAVMPNGGGANCNCNFVEPGSGKIPKCLLFVFFEDHHPGAEVGMALAGPGCPAKNALCRIEIADAVVGDSFVFGLIGEEFFPKG